MGLNFRRRRQENKRGDLVETSILDFLKLAVSVGVPLGGIVGFIVKRQDAKIEEAHRRTEEVHKRANELELAMARIATELTYIGRDIKEIKEVMNNGRRN
jgi:hypothetical protein